MEKAHPELYVRKKPKYLLFIFESIKLNFPLFVLGMKSIYANSTFMALVPFVIMRA